MERVNESRNIESETLHLSPQERIHFLANLITDKILEDQKSGRLILKKFNDK